MLMSFENYISCIRAVHENYSLHSYAQTLSSVLSFLRRNAPQAPATDPHSSIHSDVITRRLYQQPCRDSWSLAWARYDRYGSVVPTPGAEAPYSLAIQLRISTAETTRLRLAYAFFKHGCVRERSINNIRKAIAVSS